jgi:membrane protein required for colicin V production
VRGGVNWVDLIVLGVIGISALLAFARGLVREVLGIGAWVGAAFFAVWAAPFVDQRFLRWFGPDVGKPAALGAMFLAALIVLSIVSSMIGGLVRMSALGGVDRTLGMVFGLLRGVVLVAFAYIVAGWVVTADRWPAPVRQARSLPYAFEAASFAANLLPRAYRPNVALPPAGRETRVDDLLRALPQGKAIARP